VRTDLTDNIVGPAAAGDFAAGVRAQTIYCGLRWRRTGSIPDGPRAAAVFGLKTSMRWYGRRTASARFLERYRSREFWLSLSYRLLIEKCGSGVVYRPA